MHMTMSTADSLFTTLPAPGTDEPIGRVSARAVAIPAAQYLPPPLRALVLAALNAVVAIVYRGKEFGTDSGVNIWRFGIRRAYFTVHRDQTLTRISYDREDNPKPLRCIVSDIRAVGPGRQLCVMWLRRPAGCTPLLFFTLEPT